jgi:hypothetical protein
MRELDATENAPAAELEAKIHQHHRGLTSVLLRRRGRQAFKALHLEGKDGSSVGHREPPVDKPGDVAAAAWRHLAEHATRSGPGTYEVELSFAAHEKGPAPRPIVVTLAVGDEYQDLGQGADPAVVVELCMRLSGFCVSSMQAMLGKLPEVAAETTANLRELRKLGAKMFDTMQQAANASDKVAVARIEADASKERLAFARTFVEPGMAAIRDALGGAASSTLRDAAASKAPAASAPTAEQQHVAKLQADAVSEGRALAASLTESQLQQLAHVIGEELCKRLDGLRGESTSHADVFNVAADISELGPDRLMAVLKLLQEEQMQRIDRVRDIAAELKGQAAK